MSKTKVTTLSFGSTSFKEIYRHYDTLILKLMKNLELTYYIGNLLPPELQDAYTKIIVDILILHERIVPFIKLVIDNEFRQTKTEGTLFRSNTVGTKVMTYYGKIMCRSFLSKNLRLIITEMNNLPFCFEIDSNKTKLLPREINRNIQFVEDYTTKIVRVITTHMSELPKDIVEFCKHLYHKSIEYFPENANLPCIAVNGYLFLRIICPFLTTPEASGIDLSTPLTPECRRDLILITKVLQNIANNIGSVKEQYLEPTIPFVIDTAQILNECIRQACSVPEVEAKPYIFKHNYEEIDINTLFELHSLLVKASEHLKDESETQHTTNRSFQTPGSPRPNTQPSFDIQLINGSAQRTNPPVTEWKRGQISGPRANSPKTSPSPRLQNQQTPPVANEEEGIKSRSTMGPSRRSWQKVNKSGFTRSNDNFLDKSKRKELTYQELFVMIKE